ncbi:MAG TPA: alpha/beta hydrolase [Candidatus Paceibacterota bacterium]|nr:alpha/beta hydrolase [Candidatus Paceibacterota bacterium]HOK97237.1 alpha/beta hydrolase [Candidatus Paceibacterota bacterium]HPP64572.1 alpha/beta hydrolase [Candidatus Paceibacterota bacterium]
MEKELILNGLLVHTYFKKSLEKSKGNVLLLHGWGVSASIFDSLVEFLTKENFDVYLIDFPGFGESPAPKTPLVLENYSLLVKEFIEKEIKEETIVLAHSFGGRVAIKLASNFPQLIKKLVLIDSAGFVRKGLKNTLIKIFAKIFKPLFKLPVLSSLKIKVYKKIGTEDYLSNLELKKTYANIVKEDLTEEMKKISVETIIIWGKSDKTTPLEWGKKMHQLIKNSIFYEIKGGHFCFLDNSSEFNFILKNILG